MTLLKLCLFTKISWVVGTLWHINPYEIFNAKSGKSPWLAFSQFVSTVSMWCINIIVLAQPWLERNSILFYQNVLVLFHSVGYFIYIFNDSIVPIKMKIRFPKKSGPVGWSCRIHWLHFCRGVRLLQRVSWIWHKTIWRWVSSNAKYPFIVIAP